MLSVMMIMDCTSETISKQSQFNVSFIRVAEVMVLLHTAMETLTKTEILFQVISSSTSPSPDNLQVGEAIVE